MDQRSIRYFLEVATRHSIRAASERLYVAGSAISRKITMLEDQLGVQLFERTSQGMTLTPAGELYERYARDALLASETLQGELDRVKGRMRGHIRMVCLDGIISDFAIRAWTQFQARFPDVTLDVRSCAADIVTKALHDRVADIGIGANAARESGIDPVMCIRSPLLAVTAPRLMPPHLKSVRLKDMIGRLPAAIPDENFVIRRQIDACLKADRVNLTPALVTNSVDALRSFARQGGGVTFLPALAVREDLDQNRLVGVPLEDKILRAATIDILVTAGRQQPPAVSQFLACLKEVASTLSAPEHKSARAS